MKIQHWLPFFSLFFSVSASIPLTRVRRENKGYVLNLYFQHQADWNVFGANDKVRHQSLRSMGRMTRVCCRNKRCNVYLNKTLDSPRTADKITH